MARIQPAVLQVECHPYLNQKRLISHVAKHNIIVTGYSPLGSPERPWAEKGDPTLMDNPVVVKIAKKHNKTPAQVLIRFQVERKVCTIPKSVSPERIKSNFDVSIKSWSVPWFKIWFTIAGVQFLSIKRRHDWSRISWLQLERLYTIWCSRWCVCLPFCLPVLFADWWCLHCERL